MYLIRVSCEREQPLPPDHHFPTPANSSFHSTSSHSICSRSFPTISPPSYGVYQIETRFSASDIVFGLTGSKNHLYKQPTLFSAHSQRRNQRLILALR